MTKWTQKTLKHAEGDKATASLNSEIEAVNLRGNSNFYSRLVFQFSISSGILSFPPFFLFQQRELGRNTWVLCLPIMKRAFKKQK